ncbi:MAG: hypothetical protein CVT77_07030 [Alphaproteobacteria bacterium HGW-Alphaproteobacteria-16]|nr:MAG: hypothetical protein CVT77_07030 [Alphaproteobacteria bacterium HGW-Alphaproteobacteria-16]
MMFDGEAIVIKGEPPPLALRVSFGVVGLIFLAIGLFGLLNMAEYYMAPSSAVVADANPVLGSRLSRSF